MKKQIISLIALTLVLGGTTAYGAAGGKKQYNINIIGFANCTKVDESDPDCYTGGGDSSGGHSIFIPLKMETITTDICGEKKQNNKNLGEELTVAEIKKGTRILLSDSGDESLTIIDRDGTDGTAKIAIPDGGYTLWAAAAGKPGGCMDIDSIICQDDLGDAVDCKEDLSNDKFVLVGHVDVDRDKNGGKPKWENVTKQLLENAGVGSGPDGFFDFLWALYNDGVRILKLRWIAD